jgi:hypothetical protein
MKKTTLLFSVLISTILFAQKNITAYQQLAGVNKQWRNQPDVNKNLKNIAAKPLSEQQLIQFHLQQTELLLRSRDVSKFSTTLKVQRLKNLDILHGYWNKGLFPINDMHEGRQPYFIDKNNTYCAVGYIMQQTGADEMAKEINATQNYSYLLDIQHPKLMSWIAQSGFTLDELALIQPAYGGEHPVILLEMHYNNTGTDVDEYIEILETSGTAAAMGNFNEVLFYDEANVLYKTLNKNQMQQTVTGSKVIRSYLFPSNENFADAGKIVIRINATNDLVRINYNATSIIYSEKSYYSSVPNTFNDKIFNIGEDETTPIGKSLTTCGLYSFPISSANTLELLSSVASPLQLNSCVTFPVPILLSHFGYTLLNQKVNLVWETQTETNSSYFIIERSSNGIDFEAIGKILAAGNSSTVKKYSLVDENPNYINHYRLKGVDLDGKTTYSKILFVKVLQANPIKIKTNPVKDNLQLQLNFEATKIKNIKLFDFTGRQVKEVSANGNLQNIDISSLVAGKYLLQLITTNGQMYSTSFVKIN